MEPTRWGWGNIRWLDFDARPLRDFQATYYLHQGGAYYLLNRAQKRYAAAIRLTGIHTPLFEQMLAHDEKYYGRRSDSSHEDSFAQPIKAFDHRVLQSHYYQIADYWIFTCEWLPLFAQDQECVERFQADWVKFLSEEAASLAAIDHVCIDILTAVTFQNEDAGRAAEKRLGHFLDDRYTQQYARVIRRRQLRENERRDALPSG
jgi:hypothetical protein